MWRSESSRPVLRLAAAFGLTVGLAGGAVSQDLPVLVPTGFPPAVTAPVIPFTFQAFHNATAKGGSLLLDVGDSTLQGTLQFGIFPFAEGDADLSYTRFATSGLVQNGQFHQRPSSPLKGPMGNAGSCMKTTTKRTVAERWAEAITPSNQLSWSSIRSRPETE
jgi:hypothetical protein